MYLLVSIYIALPLAWVIETGWFDNVPTLAKPWVLSTPAINDLVPSNASKKFVVTPRLKNTPRPPLAPPLAAVPPIWRFVDGLVVPMPTLPFISILNCSEYEVLPEIFAIAKYWLEDTPWPHI